jgi:hypothetical protein
LEAFELLALAAEGCRAVGQQLSAREHPDPLRVVPLDLGGVPPPLRFELGLPSVSTQCPLTPVKLRSPDPIRRPKIPGSNPSILNPSIVC